MLDDFSHDILIQSRLLDRRFYFDRLDECDVAQFAVLVVLVPARIRALAVFEVFVAQ